MEGNSMKARLTNPYAVVVLTVFIALAVTLALLLVIGSQGVSIRTVAGSLLILSFDWFTVGGILFTGRAIWKWPVGQTDVYLRWERVFVMVAVLFTIFGLDLLAEMLRAAGDSVFARLGLLGYVVGAIVILVEETAFLNKREWNYSQVILYVVLAFLGQAAIGVALVQTGLVAGWGGWMTIVWNLAWLVILSVASRDNIYFPALHHVAPLVIGIVLLIQVVP